MQVLCHGPTSRQGTVPSDWGGEEGLMEEEVGQRWGRRLSLGRGGVGYRFLEVMTKCYAGLPLSRQHRARPASRTS